MPLYEIEYEIQHGENQYNQIEHVIAPDIKVAEDHAETDLRNFWPGMTDYDEDECSAEQQPWGVEIAHINSVRELVEIEAQDLTTGRIVRVPIPPLQ